MLYMIAIDYIISQLLPISDLLRSRRSVGTEAEDKSFTVLGEVMGRPRRVVEIGAGFHGKKTAECWWFPDFQMISGWFPDVRMISLKTRKNRRKKCVISHIWFLHLCFFCISGGEFCQNFSGWTIQHTSIPAYLLGKPFGNEPPNCQMWLPSGYKKRGRKISPMKLQRKKGL